MAAPIIRFCQNSKMIGVFFLVKHCTKKWSFGRILREKGSFHWTKLGHTSTIHTHKLDVCSMYTFTGWLVSNGGGQTDHSLAFFLQLVCSRVAHQGHPSYEFEFAWQLCRTCSFCKLCQWPLGWVPPLRGGVVSSWRSTSTVLMSCFFSMCFSARAQGRNRLLITIQIWGTDSRRTSAHGCVRAANG
jgi:hypothetical protein